MYNVPPHVAAQALARMKTEERVCLLDFMQSRQAKRVVKKQRQLSADPVSVGIALITAFEAVSGVAVGFEAASFVGSVALAGLAIGASILLSAKPPGQVADSAGPQFLNSTEVRQNHRQATPNKRIPYGRVLSGGDMCFETAKAPYLYHGFMISAREIDGFEQCRIGTDIIAVLSTTGDIPSGVITPQGHLDNGIITSSPDYATNLRLSVRVGTSTQTIDPLIDADFTSMDNEFRQRGIATAFLRYRWPGSTFDARQAMWGDQQAPNPLFLIRGVKVYDPRDPTQAVDDESTWKWSRNASLIQADYLRQPYGGRIDPDDIDYDKVRIAASYDDEPVGTSDGTFIPRHTIDGIVVQNQPPNEVFRGMLTANRGFVCEQAGVFWVSSSKPKTPILTINDSMLAGGFEFQGQKAKRDKVNRVRSRFIAPDREYVEADGPPYDRTDLQADDGEILSATLDLPFTGDYRTVERLEKQFLLANRLPKSMTCRIDTRALAKAAEELVNEVVVFDSDLFSIANGEYLIDSVGFTENYAVMQLQLSEYDVTIETTAWIPDDDEVPFVIADLNVS